MPKYLLALCAFILLGCRVDRVPDYGSRDAYRAGIEGCFSGPSMSGGGFMWMLAFFILLTAVVAYHLGKKGRK